MLNNDMFCYEIALNKKQHFSRVFEIKNTRYFLRKRTQPATLYFKGLRAFLCNFQDNDFEVLILKFIIIIKIF